MILVMKLPFLFLRRESSVREDRKILITSIRGLNILGNSFNSQEARKIGKRISLCYSRVNVYIRDYAKRLADGLGTGTTAKPTVCTSYGDNHTLTNRSAQ